MNDPLNLADIHARRLAGQYRGPVSPGRYGVHGQNSGVSCREIPLRRRQGAFFSFEPGMVASTLEMQIHRVVLFVYPAHSRRHACSLRRVRPRFRNLGCECRISLRLSC